MSRRVQLKFNLLIMAILALLLPAALLLGGCGGSAEAPPPPEEEVIVEQAAAPIEADFAAEDLPTDPGSEFIYMANVPGAATSVSFDLDGPWNFTSGPTDFKLTIALESPQDAAKAGGFQTDTFPDANLVAAVSWASNGRVGTSATASAAATNYSQPADDEEAAPGGGLNIYSSNGRITGQIPYDTGEGASSGNPNSNGALSGARGSASLGSTTASGAAASQYGTSQDNASQGQYVVSGKEYNFQNKDDAGWRSFGRMGPLERLRSYSDGVNVLKFPMGVGSTWTENYTETEGGRVLDVTAENTVLAMGRVRVPAGAFNNGYLLQNKVTVTSGGVSTVTWDYIWFVPGVGRVAEIISQPGEKKDVFRSAKSFFRLQEYHLP